MQELKINPIKADVGVIIARFQVDELTDGQKQLINFVKSHHDKTIIFLGVSGVTGRGNNPLDFQSRQRMIQESYGDDVLVSFIKDNPSDKGWSDQLDQNIVDLAQGQSALLYGSRDSFIPHYLGRFPTQELEPSVNCSGTELRDKIRRSSPLAEKSFRRGAIWLANNQFPTVFGTVDAAIWKKDGNNDLHLLLGQKPGETKWRFIGGFKDPSSPSDEADLKREILEETGLTAEGDVSYICSRNIDDWRYRSEKDTIRTSFFAVQYTYGFAKPNDDIANLKWFKLKDLCRENLVNSHDDLFDDFVSYAKKNLEY